MGKYSECFRVQSDPFGDESKTVAVRICLFRELGNPGELKAALDEGSVEGALIRADVVHETFQILVAASRALHAQTKDRMLTRSIYTELLYSLSPTKNISESLGTFGMNLDTKNVVAVTIGDEKGAAMSALAKKIKGKPTPLTQLPNTADYDLLKKVYHVKDPELNKGSIMDAIASRIVSKDYTS